MLVNNVMLKELNSKQNKKVSGTDISQPLHCVFIMQMLEVTLRLATCKMS